MDASDSRALSEAHLTKEADIREVVQVAAQDVDEPVAHDVLAPSPQLNDDGCVLLTLQAIAQYLETEAPDSVAVVYTHDLDRASLTASHVSSAEHEFLLRGVSMALGERLSGWVGANRQTMVNSDPALDLGDLAGAWTPRLRGSFSIPLMSNDTVLVADGLEPMSETAAEPLDAPADEAPAPARSGPRAVPSLGPRRLPVSA
jgi:hypothetical protein